jgi:hypothetical protein
VLKFTDLKDKGDWVFAAAGVGALAGGTLFGVGMTLAGGCGAGSIWRAGEGQVKLWLALAASRWGRPSRAWSCRGRSAAEARLGRVPPGALGWGLALVLTLAVWPPGPCWPPGTRTPGSSAPWTDADRRRIDARLTRGLLLYPRRPSGGTLT